MSKKELKFYEAPACEVMEVEMQGILCVSGETNADGIETGDDMDGER